jgi:hypothetical protein
VMVSFKPESRYIVSLPFLFFLISVALTASSAQSRVTPTRNEGGDIFQLRKLLAKTTQFVVDTTISGLRIHVQNLSNSTSQAVIGAKRRLANLTDSLIVPAQDSLDASRQDSLRLLGRSFELQFASHESSMRQFLDSRFSLLLEELGKAKVTFSACPECENRSDFEERMTNLKDVADSLASEFRETTTAMAGERSDLLSDAFDTARDSLCDVRDGLLENRMNDIDVWRYGASRLVLSSAYASHASYRGRDIGLVQQSFAPSVMYRHSSGFSVQLSTYWLDDEGNRWDNFQLTGGYEFRLSEIIGGSLSYTHFWFNDSSTSELSVFTDNAQGGLSLDWPAISISTLGSVSFGTASEFTLTTSVCHNFQIPLSLYNQITISPSFSWVLGQQNSELTTLLTTKGKGNRAPATTSTHTKATSSFSVLDYELSLPATIELGFVTLAPSATYIIPLNVVDASTTKSYVNLEFGVFLTIR